MQWHRHSIDLLKQHPFCQLPGRQRGPSSARVTSFCSPRCSVACAASICGERQPKHIVSSCTKSVWSKLNTVGSCGSIWRRGRSINREAAVLSLKADRVWRLRRKTRNVYRPQLIGTLQNGSRCQLHRLSQRSCCSGLTNRVLSGRNPPRPFSFLRTCRHALGGRRASAQHERRNHAQRKVLGEYLQRVVEAQRCRHHGIRHEQWRQSADNPKHRADDNGRRAALYPQAADDRQNSSVRRIQ